MMTEKKQIREKLGIKKEDFVISNIGAMTENKGIDYLLVAFAIIRKKKKANQGLPSPPGFTQECLQVFSALKVFVRFFSLLYRYLPRF